MRTLAFLMLVGSVALFAAPGAADEAAPESPPAAKEPAGPALVTLREAANAGHLKVEGFKPSSYRRVHLRIENLRSEPMRVDLCGSHLEPRTGGSCQRLGIGPVVTPRKKKVRAPRPQGSPPGTVVMSLEPGQEISLEVNTCCLDAGKPAPGSHTFRVARSKLPPVREKVLRWWADNPDTPQYCVNTAIWKFREDVIVPDGARPAEPRYGGVKGHAGMVYRLRGGELMSLDADGIERFLGTEIEDVFPTDSAIYAEAYGPAMGATRLRQRELWRLVPTGEDPWKLVAHVPLDVELRDLRVAPSGAVLVTTSKGLYRVDTRSRRFVELLPTEDVDNLSVRFERKGKVIATLRTPPHKGYYQGGELKGQGMSVCELYDVDPATGKRTLIRAFWNVRQLQTGPAGTYALTPAGKLRRLTGRSFKSAPGHNAYERILHVGRTCVWLESKKGRLVAADKSGRLRFASGPSLNRLTAWHVDRHSDDVLLLRGERHFHRLDPRGKEQEVRGPESRR